MHTVFAVLTLLITLMSGGLASYQDTGGAAAESSSAQEGDETTDLGPGMDPWG